MTRNSEFARGTSQFIELPQLQDSEGNVIRQAGITRIPNSHTKRSEALGLEGRPKAPKKSDFKNGQRPGSTKPQISEKQQLDEEAFPIEPEVDRVDHEEFREQGERIVYSNPQIDIHGGPFADLSGIMLEDPSDEDILFTPNEDAGLDALSMDRRQEHERHAFPEEKDDWSDYAETAEDLRL